MSMAPARQVVCREHRITLRAHRGVKPLRELVHHPGRRVEHTADVVRVGDVDACHLSKGHLVRLAPDPRVEKRPTSTRRGLRLEALSPVGPARRCRRCCRCRRPRRHPPLRLPAGRPAPCRPPPPARPPHPLPPDDRPITARPMVVQEEKVSTGVVGGTVSGSLRPLPTDLLLVIHVVSEPVSRRLHALDEVRPGHPAAQADGGRPLARPGMTQGGRRDRHVVSTAIQPRGRAGQYLERGLSLTRRTTRT